MLLVMHGGLGLDHHYLLPWLDGLAASGVRVVYYDHRGNGRSENTAGLPLSHAVMADDAEALRQALGAEEVFILGHSYGGFIAMEYALRHPARLRGLILTNTSPALDHPDLFAASLQRIGTPAQREALMRLLGATAASDAEFQRLWRVALPLYFHRQLSDVDYDAIVAATHCRAAAYAEVARDNIPSYDLNPRLAEIQAPTLVMTGAHDIFFPAVPDASRLAAGIPGAQQVLFQHSAHHPFIEEPERFLAVVREFLGQCHRPVHRPHEVGRLSGPGD